MKKQVQKIAKAYIDKVCDFKLQKLFIRKPYLREETNRRSSISPLQPELLPPVVILQSEREDCPRISDIINQLAEYHEAAATMSKEEFHSKQ